ncbi:hypothetical protein CPB85DRAFT_1420048, partial [Mucidula mucida]
APGFHTGARRVRVTPDLSARRQRGEEISPRPCASIARAEPEVIVPSERNWRSESLHRRLNRSVSSCWRPSRVSKDE